MRKTFATLPEFGRIFREKTLDEDTAEPRFWLAKSDKLTFNRFIIAKSAEHDEFCWLVVHIFEDDYEHIADGILSFASVIKERATDSGKVICANNDGVAITKLSRSKHTLSDFLPEERI